MVWLSCGKKFEDTFSRFDTIPACDGQTSCHGIVRAMDARRAVKITINPSNIITRMSYLITALSVSLITGCKVCTSQYSHIDARSA